ncbi:MAG: FAD-dependent oxidoreductase [Actinomycetes bacterium]
MDPDYDLVVVGAGVVGAALAREFSLTGLRTLLVDAGDDVGCATSKANTAILHTGFDAKPGTLESTLVSRGYRLLADYAAAAGIAVEPIGALLVAWDADQLAALDGIDTKAKKNGYLETRAVGASELRELEPDLGHGAVGALAVPGESIIDPWSPPIAFATEAVRNGVTLQLRRRLTSVEASDARTLLSFETGPNLTTRWLINAAGLGSDLVDEMFGHRRFHITPRRGQLIVFDKLARPLVNHILLPVPTAMGKGVLIAPTVFGNVMLGPTAEDLTDRRATETTAEGLATLLEKGRRLMPKLLDEEVTATYSGLRAATEHDDYQISVDEKQRYVCVGGIRSTGLTASLAIAEHVRSLLAEVGVDCELNRESKPPAMPNLGDQTPRPYQDATRIKSDPEYGRIACHCERVTRGELRDALVSTLAPTSVDGLRRRTRAMNGRCQGFFCAANIQAEYPVVQASPGRNS